MRPSLLFLSALCALPAVKSAVAEPEFSLTEDSKPHDGIPKGELIKGTYIADGSVFPGTERDYTIYLPPKGSRYDDTLPYAFMVFQDGVIYQAPTVFDNLIARREIPPVVGIFIKPGVVPAANENSLPRFNRSYEYDSVTDAYSRFLFDEFLPAIEQRHGIKLSADPNDAAIAGNSSGGICAFMVAWHRPDRIRRVFSGVGTYVGIHGADQLPVLVRKFEPRPLRVFLQSGTGDNNLYCGDWWMANQTMERALTWAGYDVNHAWGEGGHNQKHASQIFPEVLRWLWKDFVEKKTVKANPRGESKWVGYEVTEIDRGWEELAWKDGAAKKSTSESGLPEPPPMFELAPDKDGNVWVWGSSLDREFVVKFVTGGPKIEEVTFGEQKIWGIAAHPEGMLIHAVTPATPEKEWKRTAILFGSDGRKKSIAIEESWFDCVATNAGWCYATSANELLQFQIGGRVERLRWPVPTERGRAAPARLTLSPDQTSLYVTSWESSLVWSYQIQPDGFLAHGEPYFKLEEGDDGKTEARGLCVDTNGWLYVATALGIQVCDQAGRVNFVISTPQQPQDVCFGGTALSELFIACGDKIYKRPTKAHGIISGQMAPIKPKPPKL